MALVSIQTLVTHTLNNSRCYYSRDYSMLPIEGRSSNLSPYCKEIVLASSLFWTIL